MFVLGVYISLCKAYQSQKPFKVMISKHIHSAIPMHIEIIRFIPCPSYAIYAQKRHGAPHPSYQIPQTEYIQYLNIHPRTRLTPIPICVLFFLLLLTFLLFHLVFNISRYTLESTIINILLVALPLPVEVADAGLDRVDGVADQGEDDEEDDDDYRDYDVAFDHLWWGLMVV